MSRIFIRILITASALFPVAFGSSADEVVLKNGRTVSGLVLNEKCPVCKGTLRRPCIKCDGKGRLSDASGHDGPCGSCSGTGRQSCESCGQLGVVGGKVRIRLRPGLTVSFDRSEVLRITWKEIENGALAPLADEAYRSRLESLREDNAESQFRLGVWCVENSLEREARRHLDAAARIDNEAYAPRVGPYLKQLVQNEEKRAVQALIAALTVFRDRSAEEGAAALNKVLRLYAGTQIVRRPELQRDLISRHFKKLALAGTDSIEKILSAVADRAAARCEICNGSGQGVCPECRGNGRGICPLCAGKGVRPCPVCLGSCRLTCPKCYGRGKTQAGTLGYGMRPCPVCKGVGEVLCDICRATARVPCKSCGGSGRIKGACAACRGTGRVACPGCGGSGIRRVEKFSWGPPPVHRTGVVNVSGDGQRFRVWQGGTDGTVITVLPSGDLWRGALAGNLSRIVGKPFKLMAVSLDNRKGKRLLRFRPEAASIRGVTEGARQLDIVDLTGLLRQHIADDRQARVILERFRKQECLPGAYITVLAVFPEDTDLASVENLFWVQGQSEPVKLGQTWFSVEEIRQLRKSLRKE